MTQQMNKGNTIRLAQDAELFELQEKNLIFRDRISKSLIAIYLEQLELDEDYSKVIFEDKIRYTHHSNIRDAEYEQNNKICIYRGANKLIQQYEAKK